MFQNCGIGMKKWIYGFCDAVWGYRYDMFDGNSWVIQCKN